MLRLSLQTNLRQAQQTCRIFSSRSLQIISDGSSGTGTPACVCILLIQSLWTAAALGCAARSCSCTAQASHHTEAKRSILAVLLNYRPPQTPAIPNPVAEAWLRFGMMVHTKVSALR